MFNCINLIKISIKNNKKGFLIKKTNKNFNILKIFLKLNVIKYVKLKNNYLVAYINYVNKKPTFCNIINYYKNSNKKIISLKNLKKINKKYNWIFIISTSKGILNNFEAENNNTGGIILIKMWN